MQIWIQSLFSKVMQMKSNKILENSETRFPNCSNLSWLGEEGEISNTNLLNNIRCDNMNI